MNARAALALVLFLVAGSATAGEVQKEKLRKLAPLPSVNVVAGVGFSTTFGFSFNEDKPDPAVEIARLETERKADASDWERLQRLSVLYSKVDRKKESEDASAKAVALCRQQVREHPKDSRWLARLGDVLSDSGQVEEGEKLLRRAVKESPEDWWAWVALARCIDVRSLRAVMGDKHLTFHLVDDKVMIPTLVDRTPAAEQIADMRRLRQEARRCYDRAIALAPRETKPYFWRAASRWVHATVDAGLRMAGGEKVNLKTVLFTTQSASDMAQIARLSSDDPRAIALAVFWQFMACVLHKKMDRDAMPSSFAAFLTERHSLVDFLPKENREFIRWGLDRLEQLARGPDQRTAATASEILADALMVMDMQGGKTGLPRLRMLHPEDQTTSRVLEHLRRAVQLDPSRDRAWDLLTALLAKEGKYDEALTVARKRIAIKDNAHTRFLLGKVHAEQEQFDQATENLRAGLKREPKDLDCCLGLAAVLLKRDDATSLKEAGEQLDAALPRLKEEKGEHHRTNYQLLRGIHAALDGRPDRAKELFKQVLQRDKENTTGARALVALGDPLSPADEQLAMDYLRARGGEVRRKVKQPGSPVVTVRLIDDKFTDDDLFFVSAFTRLRWLDLYSRSITDAGLAYLRSLSALRYLGLEGTKITDAGLAYLEGCWELEELSIRGSRGDKGVTDSGLVHLRKLPKLRDVSLYLSITDKGLAHLAAIPRLQKLYIWGGKITEEGMSHFERLTKLRELKLHGTKITDAGLAHLKGLRRLRELDLAWTPITDAGLVHLQGLARLEILNLGDTAITDAGLTHLRGLTNLRELDLSDRHSLMKATLMAELPGMDPSQAKKPDKPRITDAGLKHLQGLTKLEKLNLDERPITDVGLAHLSGLGKLHDLSLDSSRITDAGLCQIEKLTHLQSLSLSETSITDAGLVHLRGLKRLGYVSLDKTKVTPKGIAELRKASPKLEVSR